MKIDSLCVYLNKILEKCVRISSLKIEGKQKKGGSDERKTRYSKKELEEFRIHINEKLEQAKREYEMLRAAVMNADSNDTTDTSPTFKILEEGASTLSKEEAGRLAQRQLKFIQNLQAALIRIENGTYGICRETGKLIPKERLRAVPHATLSIEAKKARNK